MATLQSGKCFTVPTFFGICCRSEWQERMYIYKWHEVDQTKHEIFCVHIVCNEIQVKVNLEITTFFFYLCFPYCPNFFWFGVVCILEEGKTCWVVQIGNHCKFIIIICFMLNYNFREISTMPNALLRMHGCTLFLLRMHFCFLIFSRLTNVNAFYLSCIWKTCDLKSI